MKTNDNRRERGGDFPCPSLAEALPHLRRPPTAEAVRFKIQTVAGELAQVAPYLDARLVFDRLDLVCGERWAAEFEPLPKPLRSRPVDRNGEVRVPPIDVRCRLTLFEATRQDVGAGEDPKAAFSDAIKRAAVHFGVGRALYALGAPWLREGEADGELRRNRKGRLVIDARSEAWLRAAYGRWLRERGVRLFGEPLDHGDELGAPGFEAEAGVAAEAEIDQEAAAGQVPEPRRPAEPEQLPERGDVTAPPDRETAERPQTVMGRLRAVSDGSPGEPPATALDRRALAHWRQAGGYSDATVAALAGLACGEKVVERLSREQVKRLAWLLELAVAGRVSQRTLAGAITRATRRYDLAEGAEVLEHWLREKAAEVGLLGRREAA
jgi:hypothetical protein